MDYEEVEKGKQHNNYKDRDKGKIIIENWLAVVGVVANLQRPSMIIWKPTFNFPQATI